MKKKKEVVARAQPDGEETSMNVTMKVMPPILEENNAYGKKSARKIKEQCKQIGLFRVRVKGMNYEESKNVVHELRQCLYRPSGRV